MTVPKSKTMPFIKEITAIETYIVRHPILRNGKPIENCHFEGDEDENTVHFGLFDNEKLIGVISVFENNNTSFYPEKQAQIRGMAVLETFQKRGFGSILLEHAETHLRNKKTELIWFNARDSAVLFYKKLGFITFGSSFIIPDVGEHFLMMKKLTI